MGDPICPNPRNAILVSALLLVVISISFFKEVF